MSKKATLLFSIVALLVIGALVFIFFKTSDQVGAKICSERKGALPAVLTKYFDETGQVGGYVHSFTVPGGGSALYDAHGELIGFWAMGSDPTQGYYQFEGMRSKFPKEEKISCP